MQTARRGSDLRIKITLALHSLGREHKGATKRMSIAEMELMLRDLRREQLAKGIIKPTNKAA
jgi:hypothetical protein